jgi:CheY-like chemotaxis protein
MARMVIYTSSNVNSARNEWRNIISNWINPFGVRPDVPVIMITAYGDAETKRKALEDGAEALFTKPIDFGALRSEIDMRVERAA